LGFSPVLKKASIQKDVTFKTMSWSKTILGWENPKIYAFKISLILKFKAKGVP